MRRGAFTAARFARDGSLGLFTVVKLAGEAHLLAWLQDASGDLACRAAARAHFLPRLQLRRQPLWRLPGHRLQRGWGPGRPAPRLAAVRHFAPLAVALLPCAGAVGPAGCPLPRTSQGRPARACAPLPPASCGCAAGEVAIFSAATLRPAVSVRGGAHGLRDCRGLCAGQLCAAERVWGCLSAGHPCARCVWPGARQQVQLAAAAAAHAHRGALRSRAAVVEDKQVPVVVVATSALVLVHCMMRLQDCRDLVSWPGCSHVCSAAARQGSCPSVQSQLAPGIRLS